MLVLVPIIKKQKRECRKSQKPARILTSDKRLVTDYGYVVRIRINYPVKVQRRMYLFDTMTGPTGLRWNYVVSILMSSARN